MRNSKREKDTAAIKKKRHLMHGSTKYTRRCTAREGTNEQKNGVGGTRCIDEAAMAMTRHHLPLHYVQNFFSLSVARKKATRRLETRAEMLRHWDAVRQSTRQCGVRNATDREWAAPRAHSTVELESWLSECPRSDVTGTRLDDSALGFWRIASAHNDSSCFMTVL